MRNNYEGSSNHEDQLPPGGFGVGIPLEELKKYRFSAYPGPEVIKKGRVEHLPLHVHVQEKGGKKYRINLDTLEDIDGASLPSDLRKLLKKKYVVDYLRRSASDVYQKGRLERDLSFS